MHAFQWYCKNSLNCTGRIGKLSFNPFLPTSEAHDFKINGPDGAPLAGFEKLVLEFKPSGLFDRTVRFGKLVVEQFTMNLAIEREGSLKVPFISAQSHEGPLPEQAQNLLRTRQDPCLKSSSPTSAAAHPPLFQSRIFNLSSKKGADLLRPALLGIENLGRKTIVKK